VIWSIEGLKSQCLNLKIKRKFNKIFSGRQPCRAVKVLQRFRDWLHPSLQGVADGSAEPKLFARKSFIEFCRLESFETYNEKNMLRKRTYEVVRLRNKITSCKLISVTSRHYPTILLLKGKQNGKVPRCNCFTLTLTIY
jgi:hypothetical protein